MLSVINASPTATHNPLLKLYVPPDIFVALNATFRIKPLPYLKLPNKPNRKPIEADLVKKVLYSSLFFSPSNYH